MCFIQKHHFLMDYSKYKNSFEFSLIHSVLCVGTMNMTYISRISHGARYGDKDKRQLQSITIHSRVEFVVVAGMDMPKLGHRSRKGLMKMIQ